MTKATIEHNMKEFFGTSETIEYVTVGDTRDFLDETYTILNVSTGSKVDHEKTLSGLSAKLKEFGSVVNCIIEFENVTYITYS